MRGRHAGSGGGVGRGDRGKEAPLPKVAQGAMAKVVDQTGDRDTQYFLVGDL